MENAHALDTSHGSGTKNGLLYPTMLIAAVAVIVFSILGIAAMTGLMPKAMSKSDTQPAASATLPAPRASGAAQGAGQPASSRTAAARSAAGAGACVDCGVISSIRAVSDNSAASSGLGAVAGGVVGGILGNQVGRGRGRTAMTVVGAGAGAYAGNEIEKNMHKNMNYEIRVRMDDGTYRTFFESAQPALAVGQKVRITDNGIIAG